MATGAGVNRPSGYGAGGGGGSSLLVGREPPVAAQVSQRGGPLSGGLVQTGEVEMGVGKARIQGERLAVGLDCICRAVQVFERDAEIVGGGGMVRVFAEGRPTVPLRLGGQALLVEEPAEV